MTIADGPVRVLLAALALFSAPRWRWNVKGCRRRDLVTVLLFSAACRGPVDAEDAWHKASETLMFIDGEAIARIALDSTVSVDDNQRWRLRLVALQALDRLELATEWSAFSPCPGGVRLHTRILASPLPRGAERTYGPWTLSGSADLLPMPVAAVRGGVCVWVRDSAVSTPRARLIRSSAR